MQQLHQWLVGVGEVGRHEAVGGTKEKVIAVSVEAQSRLASLRAWDVRRAEQQRTQSGLDLGGHVWTCARGADGLLGAGDVQGFHEIQGPFS